MQKLSAERVPKCLNGDQKFQGFLSSFWNFLGAIQMISCCVRFVTNEETWLYHYDSETKQQSMECRHSGTTRPKIIHIQKSTSKFWTRFFRIKTSFSSLIIFQMDKLSTRSITHLCWCKWKTCWWINTACSKITKRVLFLHDNAQDHRSLATLQKLAYLGFQCLDHPPYSPDLAPLGYHLFFGLKQ